jgi:hypothetical protein
VRSAPTGVTCALTAEGRGRLVGQEPGEPAPPKDGDRGGEK